MSPRIRQAQRGITMVESLVALVVLSIGLLGIASLYVTSLRTGRTALIRTQAVSLVMLMRTLPLPFRPRAAMRSLA